MTRIVFCLLSWVLCLEAAISGRVIDASGQPLEGARVEFRSSNGMLLHLAKSGSGGRFEWSPPNDAKYQVRVTTDGFNTGERVVSSGEFEIRLEPSSVYTRLTINAFRGGAEEAMESAHVTTILDQSDLQKRSLRTLGNALESAPGIHVQQTTTAQVSPFLRGLTGYQVLNLMDGIRFNNSTFRSGPNQYLAFIEPSQAQRVEALLGPTGAQYGSDSLGGTIHVRTEEARFADDGQWQTHGNFTLGGASADLSGFAAGRVSVASEKVFWLFGASGRKHNDLRAGQGQDSRNVYHRFFGMPLDEVRDLLGSRQQDTGFRQYGLETKIAIRPRVDQLVSFNYQRGVQDQVRGYKDLLGGLGRLKSDFTPQDLNWFYGRYEVLSKSIFDSVSGTFSSNRQTDGSSRQNLLATDAITTDLSTVQVYGYSGLATTHWTQRLQLSFGGDAYDERIGSTRDVLNPVSGARTRPRPLYPNNSRYGNFGLFTQGNWQVHRKLRASAGVRWTGIRFSDTRNTLWFRDTTFHSSLRWDLTSFFGLHAVVSRGFRAPNLNDLGALGLNDLGYEIPAAEAIPLGALLSTDAGEGATSKGQSIRALAAESLMNYEFGMRITTRKFFMRVQGFNADLTDPIVRRTLLFAAGNVPAQLAGLPVTPLTPSAAQRAQGVVTVATGQDPRAVKAFVNDGASRYYGMESQSRYLFSRSLTLEANYSYIVGRDLSPNRNIRRLPPQSGTVTVRHTPGGRRPWVEVSMTATGAQNRLSGGDVDDERIGASFRRADIASFFRGTRVSQYLDNGVFRPTGESLLQIQNRVLPGLSDTVRVPLYRSTAGWTAVALRSGMPIGERWQLMGAVENLLDRNYRMHGSGIDSAGFNVYLSISYRF